MDFNFSPNKMSFGANKNIFDSSKFLEDFRSSSASAGFGLTDAVNGGIGGGTALKNLSSMYTGNSVNSAVQPGAGGFSLNPSRSDVFNPSGSQISSMIRPPQTGGGKGLFGSLADGFKTDGKLDFGKINAFGQLAIGGFGAYLSAKQLGLMKKQFEFQKSFDKTNLQNSALASNVNKADKQTGQLNRDYAGGITKKYSNGFDGDAFADLGPAKGSRSNEEKMKAKG